MKGTKKLGKNAEQNIKNIAKQNNRNNITSVSYYNYIDNNLSSSGNKLCIWRKWTNIKSATR